MRVGKLRHRIIIETPTTTITDCGDTSITWTTYATRWAAIEPQRASEVVDADQRKAKGYYLITIRYTSGVDQTMRLKFGSRYFYITSVVNTEERNSEMVLEAVEHK